MVTTTLNLDRVCRIHFRGPTAYERAIAMVQALTEARGAFTAIEPWPDGEWVVYYKPENEQFVKTNKIPHD